MAIKSIVTISDLGGPRDAASVAANLAAELEAQLIGLALVHDPIIPGYSIAPIPTDFIVLARDNALDQAKAARDAFIEIARRSNVPADAQIVDVMAGGYYDSMLHHTRLSDLVVVGQDDPSRPEPARLTVIEAILFDAGVPVMMVPYSGKTSLKLDRAMIAWNGGGPASLAIRGAMPLLERAKSILAVIVDDGRLGDSMPEVDIGRYLSHHGLEVEVRRVPRESEKVSTTLLHVAEQEKIDWMVMGAYGQSRIKEFVLGGTTRAMFEKLSVPVVMAH